MPTPIAVPQLGVVEEVVIIEWLYVTGDTVTSGDDLVVIETDKAETRLLAPASGRLEIVVEPSDQEVPVGTILGYVDDGTP